MILRSLVSHEGRLQPVEVEIELTPGLPQMHFLGLADQGIKESIYRIKCALRQQGFEYPRTQQILVNLRPAHFRKSSRGLELAVATGLLAKTGQIQWPTSNQKMIVYGELSLSGEVREPDDLGKFVSDPEQELLTGFGDQKLSTRKYFVKSLKALKKSNYEFSEAKSWIWQRPTLNADFLWTEAQAEWIRIHAAGGHSSLLAGPGGLGKTTLAQHLLEYLPAPNLDWLSSYQKHFEALHWRPLIQPHHSISSQGLLGGGVPLAPGEISRAHGGVLILDELLEFNSDALEALREPLEEGLIRIRKRNFRETFPADFQLIATTNLCRCGDWTPGRARNCHYSVTQCFSTLRRFSGPFLDRFQTVFFVNEPKKGHINGQSILAELEKVYQFQSKQNRPQKNAQLSEVELKVPKSLIQIHSLDELSQRRKLSTLRVARTLADLDFAENIEDRHIERARQWSLRPFLQLKKGSS